MRENGINTGTNNKQQGKKTTNETNTNDYNYTFETLCL